ncbi:MAG: FAD-binding protein, partial [Terracidiphilus sp.]
MNRTIAQTSVRNLEPSDEESATTRDGKLDFDFDFIVIGSGFGGSVSALRLAEKGDRVAVIEMGRRWTPDNLPRTSWSIHRWIWRPNLGLRGFFNIQFFKHATIFHGCAVGGGSITYACTLLQPPEKVWGAGSWTGLADWKT